MTTQHPQISLLPEPKQERWVAGLFIGIAAAVMLFIVLTTQGTYDDGDSLMHYLIAKYVFVHPHLLLDVWGKPLFTLIAAPAAAVSFGMLRALNMLLGIGTLTLTWLLARRLDMPNAWLAPLMLFLMPEFVPCQLSGLTEPLFGFMLISAVYLVWHGQRVWAAVIVSFLPFVRSEGLIMILTFGIILIVYKNYKALPWLTLGSVFYSIIGSIFKSGDLLWAFRLPYAGGESYGKGSYFDYIDKLYWITGLPLFILGMAGILLVFWHFYRNKTEKTPSYFFWVICGLFGAMFVSHTLFWGAGLFHAFLLDRILVPVLSLFALLALYAFNEGLKYVNINWGLVVVGIIVVFPFIGNPSGFRWQRDFELSDSQLETQKFCKAIKEWNGGKKPGMMLFDSPSIAYYMGVDLFDSTQYRQMRTLHQDTELPEGAVVVWDAWFAVVESHVPLEYVLQHPQLKLLYRNKTSQYPLYLFEYRSSDIQLAYHKNKNNELN